jgi:ferritin-like metal-binding protein YciE
MAVDIKAQLLRYLSDAHAAEVSGLASLKELAEVATDADVKQVAAEHVTVTQSQVERLEARIRSLGGDIPSIFQSHEDKQTQGVINAFSLEHSEAGMYTSIEAYADAIGDTETARLATAFIAEEQMAAERLGRLIPQVATATLKNSAGTPSAA